MNFIFFNVIKLLIQILNNTLPALYKTALLSNFGFSLFYYTIFKSISDSAKIGFIFFKSFYFYSNFWFYKNYPKIYI